MIEHLDALPARLDIRAWQGDNFMLSLQVVYVDAYGVETPVDIGNANGRMLIKRHPHFEVDAKLGFIADDPAQGMFSMYLEHGQMEKLDGSYVYDVKLDDKTVAWGSFYVYSAVSERIA